MKVRATRTGYYEHLRRREGDVFELVTKKGHKKDDNGKLVPHTFTPEEQFSERWMEKVSKHTPEKVSTAQKALNAVQADLKAGRFPAPAVEDATGNTEVI